MTDKIPQHPLTDFIRGNPHNRFTQAKLKAEVHRIGLDEHTEDSLFKGLSAIGEALFAQGAGDVDEYQACADQICTKIMEQSLCTNKEKLMSIYVPVVHNIVEEYYGQELWGETTLKYFDGAVNVANVVSGGNVTAMDISVAILDHFGIAVARPGQTGSLSRLADSASEPKKINAPKPGLV